MKKKMILISVFNKIDYDGRVQRTAETLSKKFKIVVFSVDSGLNYQNPKFLVYPISLLKFNNLKILKHIYFWLKLILFTLKIRPSIVYANDFYLGPIGWISAKIVNAEFVYDAHELIIKDKYEKFKFKKYFWYLWEKLIVKKCDLLIAANEDRAKIMKQYYKLQKMPLVIRNISRRNMVTLTTMEVFNLYPNLKHCFSNKKIKIVYQGYMDLKRGIDFIIYLIKQLDENYQLLLIGDGPDFKEIIKIVEKNNLQNKIIPVGKVLNKHMISILKLCNIGIVTYPLKGLNNIYCASNKIYDYCQAGLPVVTTCQITLKKIVRKYNIGVVIGCGYNSINNIPLEEFKNAIKKIQINYDYYKENINTFLKENNWENVDSKILLQEITRLCES